MAEHASIFQNASDIPIDMIDVSDPALFQSNQHWALFRRLRSEDPVHYVSNSSYGPYWAITKYNDILEVEINHEVFSSRNALTLDEIHLTGVSEDSIPVGGMIAMDPPMHDEQRKIVSPALAPSNLVRLESAIRERASKVLDEVPKGREFDWVEGVSTKLTMLMLGTLLDYPLERLDELRYWSDIIAGIPGDGVVESYEQRDRELKVMAGRFLELRAERRTSEQKADIISMFANSAAGRDLSDRDYLSNITLLIVGGNDTTRNTMSGSVVGFNEYPEEWEKLRAKPELVPGLVSESIRYQTPVMYQGRRATADYELRGKRIRKGDKVTIWYVSGNRDEEVIESADRFIIDRERPREHLSFGFGIHRCLGNRLAELQVRILWEEILKRGWRRIQTTAPAVYPYHNLQRSIVSLPVCIHL